jgi:hypothetical protein
MLDFSRVPYLQLPLPERGRPGPRLLRGLLWATVAIFVISILAFVVGLILALEPQLCENALC